MWYTSVPSAASLLLSLQIVARSYSRYICTQTHARLFADGVTECTVTPSASGRIVQNTNTLETSIFKQTGMKICTSPSCPVALCILIPDARKTVVLFLKSCTHPELATENFPEISLSSLHWIVVQASWKIFKALFWMLYFFRPANSFFVLHLSSFLKYLKETPHTMLRYGYFSAKSSLRITLVGNILYYACQTGIFQIRLKRFC